MEMTEKQFRTLSQNMIALATAVTLKLVRETVDARNLAHCDIEAAIRRTEHLVNLTESNARHAFNVGGDQ